MLYQGTDIVSIAHIEFLDGTIAALRSLATDTPNKNKGHAAFFLAFLEKWLMQQGVTCLKMHARRTAEAFYKKYGYTNMVFEDTPSLNEDYVDLGKKLI